MTLDLLTLAVEGVDALAKIDQYQARADAVDIDVLWDNLAGRPHVSGGTWISGGRAL